MIIKIIIKNIKIISGVLRRLTNQGEIFKKFLLKTP